MAASHTIEQQVERLDEAVELLQREALSLSEESMLGCLGGWSPRDILAHLIGWNSAIIEGCRQLLAGELPFYDVDPGDDYSRINERFVREYVSMDRKDLLANLSRSAAQLGRFLGSLDPADWSRDSGVVHGEEHLTIRGTVDDLISDYLHHCEQIRSLGVR